MLERKPQIQFGFLLSKIGLIHVRCISIA